MTLKTYATTISTKSGASVSLHPTLKVLEHNTESFVVRVSEAGLRDFKSAGLRFLRASCRTGGEYRHHNGLFKYNRRLMPFFIVKLQHNRACIVKSIIPDQSKYKVNVSDDGITLSCYLKIQKKFHICKSCAKIHISIAIAFL